MVQGEEDSGGGALSVCSKLLTGMFWFVWAYKLIWHHLCAIVASQEGHAFALESIEHHMSGGLRHTATPARALSMF